MTRNALRGMWVGCLGLLSLPGCGSVCGDDGLVWQQAGNPACVPAAEAGESETDAATTTANTDNTDATDPTEDPTDGSATMGGGLWCEDVDGDGFGDPMKCQEQQGPGTVENNLDCDDASKETFPGAAESDSPMACMADLDGDGWGDDTPGPGVDPGTDCDDGNGFAFPGAAENESPSACMEDTDGDGWGDDMPGPGVDPGTDCNDDNMAIFPGAAEKDDMNACMEDADGDGHGDATPSDPDVPPGTDCDDTNEHTFPGAAPNDAPEACMRDVDGDDWGDDTPPPDVLPGSDCADDSPFAFPGAAEIEGPNACMEDEDDDGYGDIDPPDGAMPGTDCNDADARVQIDCEKCEPNTVECVGSSLITCSAQGNVKVKEVCEFGCDDAAKKCLEVLEVDAGPTVCIEVGGATQLMASVMGGDGAYTYDWSPANTLDDPMIADPLASPVGPTSYTVEVSDGVGNLASDSVTVYLNNLALELNPDICETYDFPWANDLATIWKWDADKKELCQTVNGKPSALFCGWDLDNATVKGTFRVNSPATDDDFVGFMWGIQDTSHFYIFQWKRAAQNFGVPCGGNVPAGMMVKVVDVKDPMMNPFTCADVHAPADTANSKLLLAPADFSTAPWNFDTDYLFELTHKNTGEATIIVRNKANMMIIAEKTFMDTTYLAGKFGQYTYSQVGACFSDYKTFCLE
jgi:hypothetical protein